MTTTDTTSPPILTATLAAHRIQLAAHEAGLPLPFEAVAHRGGTTLQFHLDYLTAWVLWLDAAIDTRRVGDNLHHVAHVDWQDWAFRLVAVTAVA